MTEQNNPYKAPDSEVIEKTENTAGTSTVAISRPIGEGWAWIKDAFALFKPNAFLWIGLFIVYFIVLIVCSIIPLLGMILSYIIGPLLMAGIAQCAYDQDTRGEFEIGTLFSGFSHQTGRLIAAGFIMLGLIIVCMLPMIITMGAAFMGSMATENIDPEQMQGIGTTAILGVLITLALVIPATMAYWFAPILIKLNDVRPFEAFKLSFFACLKNILPLLWYSIIATVLVIVGLIPLGLGLLVVLPVLVIAMYTSYKDIFSGQPV